MGVPQPADDSDVAHWAAWLWQKHATYQDIADTLGSASPEAVRVGIANWCRRRGIPLPLTRRPPQRRKVRAAIRGVHHPVTDTRG